MPELWGVLNVTPDSFSDGGRYLEPGSGGRTRPAFVAGGRRRARYRWRIIAARRPNATATASIRCRRPRRFGASCPSSRCWRDGSGRVFPSIRSSQRWPWQRSRQAPAVVNDVRCAEDPALAEAAAAKGADYVIMHNRGRGELRSPNTDYGDVVEDVLAELLAAAERVERAGVPRASVWLDPGLGFAKTAAQSAVLLSSLGRFRKTGYRVLVGPSRKSFIAELAPNPGGEPPTADNRLGGTAAAVAICVAAGVDAVRVHDVFVMRQLIRVTRALHDAGGGVR